MTWILVYNRTNNTLIVDPVENRGVDAREFTYADDTEPAVTTLINDGQLVNVPIYFDPSNDDYVDYEARVAAAEVISRNGGTWTPPPPQDRPLGLHEIDLMIRTGRLSEAQLIDLIIANAPGGGGGSSMSDHLAALDPHPQYTTNSEVDTIVNAALTALKNGAPANRDTLGELSTAIDDLNSSVTAVSGEVATSSAADRNRANHTGSQDSSTIADLTEAVQDIVAGFLAEGTNIAYAYDDNANTFTISTTAAGIDAEQVRDIVGATIVQGSGISVLVDDPGDTITISVSGLTISQITGLQAALDSKAQTVHVHSADQITTGILSPARLGTGTPDSSSFLRGDSTYVGLPTLAEAEAGTATAARPWSATRVRQAIHALMPTVGDGALSVAKIANLQSLLDGKASQLHSHTYSSILGTKDIGISIWDGSAFPERPDCVVCFYIGGTPASAPVDRQDPDFWLRRKAV